MKLLRDILAILIYLASVVYLAITWRRLPAIVPSHFGIDGQPNGYAPRLLFAIIFAIVPLALLLAITICSRFPKYFNLPRPVGDPIRAQLEAEARQLLAWLRLEIAAMFAMLCVLSIQSALHRVGIGTYPMLVGIAIVVATTIVYIVRLNRIANAKSL